ncbi:c-type cytochrome [Neptuniibacter caesariensis]|uniref:Cytochrome c-554 n=1 Tax=Neptuniibacter caesariensis TaxID=207954 RepID=A0A7U8C6Q3_NEPCE|nr:cytochrome c [Neptuniibacter caesariensis]EAR62583.1 cytochrome c-554 [Oceanospirillum sp. MED92] [Neptuniibacter caesariensis]
MKQLAKIAICSAVLATASAPTMAEAFKDEIKARQGYYQVIKYNFGVLGAMVKGKKDYDADTATTAANNIYNLSKLNNGMLWPKGSDNSQLDTTKAKPGIWENFDDVKQKHGNWQKAVKTLAGEAGNGLSSLKKSFGPVGKSCKSCHDEYKAK